MNTLTPRGKVARALVTAVGGVLLLAGTLCGQDDYFPFGPFRMYATASGPSEPAPDTRLEGVDATGALVLFTERNSGIRRAEIEGQQSRYVADPDRLADAARAYAEHNPDAPTLAEVRIVIRWYDIKYSRPTGRYTDETVVSWRAP